ncbi:MAG: hypothetical protein WCJ37_02225 [Syntrophus sp. (in: bacteria)]
MKELCTKYLTDARENREVEIDGRVEKYLGNEKKKVDEEQYNLSLVSYIKGRLTNIQDPSQVIILGSLLSLVGVSMIVKKDGLKNSISSMVRSIIGRM